MATNTKTLKAYQITDQRRGAVMTAARKRKAAERHEAIAAKFRQEALELDAEIARLVEAEQQAS